MLAKIRNLTNQNLLNYLFILYAFSIPLGRASIVISSSLIILVWLMSGSVIEDLKKSLQSKAIKALAIYILFCVLALTWVEWGNMYMAVMDVRKFLYFLPIVIITMHIKPENIYKVMSAFIFALFLSELLSYGIYFELFTFKQVPPDNPTPFMNHLDYSLFLALTSLIILSRLIYEKNLKFRFVYLMFYLTITINLFIGQGRIGQLALVVTIFILFLNIFTNKIKAFSLSLALIVGLLVSAYNWSDTFHMRVDVGLKDISGIVENQDYCTSWGQRFGAILITKDILMEHPLLGVGNEDHLDKLKEIIKEKYPKMECFSWYMHYHNQYLEVLAQTGIVGLLLFMVIFYQLYRLKFQNREFTLIKTIFISVYLVGFIADPFFLFKIFTMAMFVFFFAVLNAQYFIENNLRKN